MLTQNFIPLSLESVSAQEDQPAQCRPQLLYRNLVRKMQNTPIFKRLIQLQAKTQSTSQIIGNGKAITSKMRIKLIAWLEKLSLETFLFSIQTLILAIKMLDEYLCVTNESPKVLQLVGCACLYLAAKIKEVIIVAGQCYVAASAGCFTEEQLIVKEMQIFKTLNYNTTFSCPTRVYKLICQKQQCQTLANYYIKNVEALFLEITKNLDFRLWKEYHVVSMIVSLILVEKKVPQSTQLIEMLKVHSVF